jgi:hypothetical protein
MGITRAQYLAGDNNDGPVLAGEPQAVTAGFGVIIDGNGVLSVNVAALPTAQIVNLGVIEPIDGIETTFTLAPYGTTTPFTLGVPGNLAVFLGGVPQLPGDAYTVSGNQITFVTAPPIGINFLAITAVSA